MELPNIIYAKPGHYQAPTDDVYGVWKATSDPLHVAYVPKTALDDALDIINRSLTLLRETQDKLAEAMTLARDQEEELTRLNDLLNAIGDRAHELSTGPAVPDGYREIRQMAYEG